MGLKLGSGLGAALGTGLGALLALPTGGLSVLGGAAIGGALGGGVGTAIEGDAALKDYNEAQIAQSDKQMAFQERMSNTAHQREVEDLKKAGLNPVLSAGGGGASSASGTQAILANPAEVKANVFSKVVSTASQLADVRMKDEAIRTERTRQAVNEAEYSGMLLDNAITENAARLSSLKTAFLERNPWLLKAEIVGDTAGRWAGAARDVADAGLSVGKMGSLGRIRRRMLMGY